MKKFIPAFKDLISAFKDKSIRIQIVIAIITVILGHIIKLTYLEWIAVIICIGMVITLEMVNTCIERVCDLIKTQKDDKIAYIKDLSAASVLIAAFISLCVAVIIMTGMIQ